MDHFLQLLEQLGLGVASSSLYEVVKNLASKPLRRDDLIQDVQDCIDLHGVSIRAETVISALAEHGFIFISGSDLYAEQKLLLGSQGGSASISDSSLRTSRTSIIVRYEGVVEARGQGQICQNADGSISIYT